MEVHTSEIYSWVSSRSVQTIMINENMIKWLIPLMSKTDDLSDYTLGIIPCSLVVRHEHVLVRECFRVRCCLADESMLAYEWT